MVHKKIKKKGHYDENIIQEYMRMGMNLESAKNRAWVEDEDLSDVEAPKKVK